MNLHTNLVDFIENLKLKEVATWAGSTIYNRGKDYYEYGNVSDIEVQDEKTITAEVTGSDDYELSIEEKNGKIDIDCDCPYDGSPCKHIVALLLQVVKDKINILEEVQEKIKENNLDENEGKAFEKYLASLPAEELKNMVRLYMPNHLKKLFFIKKAQPKTQKISIEHLQKEIENILAKDYNTCSKIEKMEAKLENVFEKLKDFWETHTKEIVNLIVYTAQRIEEKIEEGDIVDYEEYYDGYTYEELSDYVVSFVKYLPTPTKITTFSELWKGLKNLSYVDVYAFQSDLKNCFDDEDVPKLKLYFIDFLYGKEVENQIILIRKMYDFLLPHLDDNEKLLYLEKTYLFNDSSTFTYATYFAEKHHQVIKPIEIIDSWYERKYANAHTGFIKIDKNYQNLVSLLIQNAPKYPEISEKTLTWIMNAAPYSYVLEEVIKVLPAQTLVFEKILAVKNQLEYATYLEHERRLEEALAILEKNYINYLYDFYVRNKRAMPEKAIPFFGKELGKVIHGTGDSNYERSTAILQQLQPLLPAEDFKEKIEIIKETYKRRPNFMALLRKHFGNL